MLINVESTHISPHLINVIDRPKSGTSHTDGPVKISGWVYETLNQPVKLAIKSENDISFYDLNVRRVDVLDHLKNQGHKEDISAVLGFSVEQPLDKDVEIGFSTSGNIEWLYKIKAEEKNDPFKYRKIKLGVLNTVSKLLYHTPRNNLFR